MTTKINKRKEVKFESAKEFLSYNRNLVYNKLNNEFRFLKVDIKELSIKYFNYVISSKYNDLFTCIINKKDVSKLIDNSITLFKNQLDTVYQENFVESNKFEKEQLQDKFNSKSL